MKKILFAVLFVCAFAGITSAETTEQLVVDNGQLVVNKIMEVGRCPMPAIAVPEQDLPKIRAIVEKGSGEYAQKQTVAIVLAFGFPLQERQQAVVSTVRFQNGAWLAPNMSTTWKLQGSWLMTVLCALIMVIFSVMVQLLLNIRGFKKGHVIGIFLIAYCLAITMMASLVISMIVVGWITFHYLLWKVGKITIWSNPNDLHHLDPYAL